jgi:hypothetical protein
MTPTSIETFRTSTGTPASGVRISGDSRNSIFCSQPLTLEGPAGEDGEMNTDPKFSFLPKLPPCKAVVKIHPFPIMHTSLLRSQVSRNWLNANPPKPCDF